MTLCLPDCCCRLGECSYLCSSAHPLHSQVILALLVAREGADMDVVRARAEAALKSAGGVGRDGAHGPLDVR